MYKVTLKNPDYRGESFEPTEICYNQNGQMIGVVMDGDIFYRMSDIEKIIHYVPEQIYLPATDPTPEKRPFNVGDRVKVVSLEAANKEWGCDNVSEYDYKIGDTATIAFIFPNDTEVTLNGFAYGAHIDDLDHID